MTGNRPFNELTEGFSEARKARVVTRLSELKTGLALHELPQARERSQEDTQGRPGAFVARFTTAATSAPRFSTKTTTGIATRRADAAWRKPQRPLRRQIGGSHYTLIRPTDCLPELKGIFVGAKFERFPLERRHESIPPLLDHQPSAANHVVGGAGDLCSGMERDCARSSGR